MGKSYPNESKEYRKARDALLKEEQKLVDTVKSVAAKRRKLPLGGELKEDYVFEWATDGKLGKKVKLSQLFGDKKTLLFYSMMYGPGWGDTACPSCTSLVDGFDRAVIPINLTDVSFAVVAKAPADRVNAWAKRRGWTQMPLVSGLHNTYQTDYHCQVGSDDDQWPMMQVFVKRNGRIYHFWGSDLASNQVDMVWPYWNLMDMTPQGRPDGGAPPQDYVCEFLGV